MDTTSTGTRKRITKWAIGARIAPGIPHVPGIGITPHNIPIFVVSDILMDPVFGEILQEFSIEQGVIDTQMEPELGESGNRGLENARIWGVVNKGSAIVRGGFFRKVCEVGIDVNGKCMRWCKHERYLCKELVPVKYFSGK